MRNTDGGVLLLVKLQAYQIAQCIIYIHQVWDYSTVNLESIKKAISNFNWNKAFENLCIYETVGLLNQTLLNIFRNYIPNKKDLNVTIDSLHGWLIKQTVFWKKDVNWLSIFYRNGQVESDRDKQLEKSEDCTRDFWS